MIGEGTACPRVRIFKWEIMSAPFCPMRIRLIWRQCGVVMTA